MSSNVFPVRVVFHLDGSGVCYDRRSPIHLDSLLNYLLVPYKSSVPGGGLNRSDPIDEFGLPLKPCGEKPFRFWAASALMPIGEVVETSSFWQKKFNERDADFCNGVPNTENATYCNRLKSFPVFLIWEMEAFAMVPSITKISILKRFKYLGKKHHEGYGRVIGVDIEPCDKNYSVVRGGIAMRWIPHASGTHFLRPRPPYWSLQDRTQCIAPGEPVPQEIIDLYS